VNYRPEYRHTWGSKTYYRQLQIDPLPPETCEALLDALLGSEAALASVKRLVIERTEGNPFFIEESIRSLVETGVLAGERGAYRLTRMVQGLQVPATAEAMLAARIDRLPAEHRRLLQVAAVVGKEVPFALLQAVADLPEAALRRGLEGLQAAEFLYETGLAPDLAYGFKHALTHEVAYRSLPLARRQALHARIVATIEKLYDDRLGEHVERLAHHALHGALADKALHYLRQAGLNAAARAAPQDARVRFEQALDVLVTLPESPSTLEQAFEIRLELRPVMQLLGEGRRMLERLGEAEALAERLNDDHRRGRVCALATNDHSRLGELDEALVSGARALEIAGRLGDLRLRILTTSFLAQTHYYRGEYERAAQLATDNLAVLPADWIHEFLGNSAPASVYDRACLARSLVELGRFTEAAAYEVKAIRIAESMQHPFTLAAANWAAIMHSLVEGDWATARSRIEHEIAVARAGSVVFLLPFAVAASAWALAELGEAVGALTRLREGQGLLERIEPTGGLAHRTWVYHALGRAALLLGRLEEAQDLADRAVETVPSQRGFAAHALHLLGDVASHPGRLHAARGEARYQEALALAEPRGMRPLVAHCHLGLGTLCRRTGRHLRARDHHVTATGLYRDLGMTSWLGQADRALAEAS
jgi:tetratricopeptide (TPR) repeat protein